MRASERGGKRGARWSAESFVEAKCYCMVDGKRVSSEALLVTHDASIVMIVRRMGKTKLWSV